MNAVIKKYKSIKSLLSASILVLANTIALPLYAIPSHDISLLVVYTDSARTWANTTGVSCSQLISNNSDKLSKASALTGISHPCYTVSGLGNSTSSIDNLIDISLAELNQIYANSGLTDVSFSLAGSALIENANGTKYSEAFDEDIEGHNEPAAQSIALSAGIPQQLYRLRNKDDDATANDIIINSIHDLRAQTGADLVIMLVNGDDAEPENGGPLAALGLNIGGLAMGIGVRDPRNGFAALRIQSSNAPSYVFSHEVSHLFGANHYDFREVPFLGPQDNIAEFPNLVSNKIDSWSFQNTVENGTPRYDMYSTIMGGCVDAAGIPVITDNLSLGWQANLNAEGTCEAVTPSGTGTPTSCTVIPLLSSSLATLTTGIKTHASISDVDESTCITLTSADMTESKTVKLTDFDGTPRNNARVMPNYAAMIDNFGSDLQNLHTPQEAIVGVDFGPTQVNGWTVEIDPGPTFKTLLYMPYDAETIDTDCDGTTSGPCDRYWNNVTNPNAGTQLILKNTNKQSLGNVDDQLTIVKKFYGTTSLPTTLNGLYAYGRDEGEAQALTDAFTAVRLYTNPVVSFSGLEEDNYIFRVFGITNTADQFRVNRFYLTSEDALGNSVETMKKLGTQGNVARFVEFTDVRPVDGVVTLRVSPDLSVPFFSSVGLSAVTYFPTPQ